MGPVSGGSGRNWPLEPPGDACASNSGGGVPSAHAGTWLSRCSARRRAIRGASRRSREPNCFRLCATGCRRKASSTAASSPSRTAPTVCPCTSTTARRPRAPSSSAPTASARRCGGCSGPARAGGGLGLVSAAGIAVRGFGDEALAIRDAVGRLALCARAALGRRLLLVRHAAERRRGRFEPRGGVCRLARANSGGAARGGRR